MPTKSKTGAMPLEKIYFQTLNILKDYLSNIHDLLS
jgi:hypothetical protein